MLSKLSEFSILIEIYPCIKDAKVVDNCECLFTIVITILFDCGSLKFRFESLLSILLMASVLRLWRGSSFFEHESGDNIIF